jgi:bacillithiol system protein YtxJ
LSLVLHQAEVVVLLPIQITTEEEDSMNWIELTAEKDLDTIIEASHSKPQLIFKHSTRCSISSIAKSRMDKSDVDNTCDCYYLDLIAHRNISNLIAEKFHVHHESPQVILIQNGECTYDESHNSIRPDDILENVSTKN